jgi:hypothetical protein
MQNTAAVFRTQKTLEEDCQLISKAQESFHDVQLSDRSLIWNSDLIETIELGKLLINVCITMYSAEARKEVRGAQARADFTTRDDVHWMQHATVGTWFSVQIQERISPIAYHLQLPDSSTSYTMVYVSQLKWAKGFQGSVSAQLPPNSLQHRVTLQIMGEHLNPSHLDQVARAAGGIRDMGEDCQALKQAFPDDAAWGQASFQEWGNVYRHPATAQPEGPLAKVSP